jgi:hypothetical protein
MARSLQPYGHLSPVVVCRRIERYELIDRFKRLGAARTLTGMSHLSDRLLEADECTAEAAVYGLNRVGGHTRELEEDSRRTASRTSAWLPSCNGTICRAAVGDNSPARSSSLVLVPTARSAPAQGTSSPCAAQPFRHPRLAPMSSRTRAWMIQALSSAASVLSHK